MFAAFSVTKDRKLLRHEQILSFNSKLRYEKKWIRRIA
jgi:hypothetical protein